MKQVFKRVQRKLGSFYSRKRCDKIPDFIYAIGERFKDDNRDLYITNKRYKVIKRKGKYNFTENQKWYKYTCSKCGWSEGWVLEGNLKKGTGCSCCNGNTVVEGINDIPTTNPWMISYFKGGYSEAKLYTYCSNKKIYPVCPDCGKTKDKPLSIGNIYKNHSINCVCSDSVSYPNKYAYAFLKQLPIDKLTREWQPYWLTPYYYDNYFEYNGNKYVMEMDGNLGHGNSTWGNKKDTEGKQRDTYKDTIAKKHNVIVIRIDCKESNSELIKHNILNNKELGIFDLSNVDWVLCEKAATSNLVKSICVYFNENQNKTVVDIATDFNLNHNTIRRYLKTGTKIGWCKYDGKLEQIKSYQRRKANKVKVIKDNVEYGVFRSAGELSKVSFELFGVQFNKEKIRLVCIGRNKTHKGFSFAYV